MSGQPPEQRIFAVYPLITIFAADEAEASKTLYALEDAINATEGVSTFLDEECYENVSDDRPDQPWVPSRV